MSGSSWSVVDPERYFPIYYAGHVLTAHAARTPIELDSLLDQSLREVGAGAQWDRLHGLARHIQTRLPLSFNQAGCLLGEMRVWRELGRALPSPGRRYLSRVWKPDAKRLLHQISSRLEDASLGDRVWKIGKRVGFQRSKIQKPSLVACSDYYWAPIELDVDALTKGWLNLECLPELWPDKVDLAFDFEDEFGWLFEDAHQRVQNAISVSHQALLFGDRPSATFQRAPPGRWHGASPSNRPKPEYPEIVSPPLSVDAKLTWLIAASHVRMANKLIDQRQGALALQHADAALRLAEGSFFWSARGFVRLALKQFRAAITDFDTAIRANLRNADAYIGLGAAHLGAGDLQRALMYCNSAMGFGLADGRLHELRGCICHDLGNFVTAIDNYNEARKLLGSAYSLRIDGFILEAENEQCRSNREAIYELGIFGFRG
jgi:hypothetical protein